MTRTDIHRPSAPEFDPEAYELHGLFDLRPEFGDGGARIRAVGRLVAEGYRFGGAAGSHVCGHCGQHIRYVALMARADVMQMIYVGETCLDNRFDGTKADFQALREQAARARAEKAKQHGIALLLNERPTLLALADSNHPAHANDFVADIAYKLFQYGEISERQADAVERAIVRQAEWAARDAERAAAKASLVASGVQAPEGKVTVTGTILSTKVQDSMYGVQYKMLVGHEDGWKVWGTVPKNLLDANGLDALKGRTVTFTATLERSRDDALFAFAKKPSKASVAA